MAEGDNMNEDLTVKELQNRTGEFREETRQVIRITFKQPFPYSQPLRDIFLKILNTRNGFIYKGNESVISISTTGEISVVNARNQVRRDVIRAFKLVYAIEQAILSNINEEG